MSCNLINNPWCIIERNFNIEDNYVNETLFSLGNGYIGMRGNFEEGYSGPKGTGLQGIYINGFYEIEPIKYGEAAYGYAEKSQTMLNVTDSKVIRLFVEDEEFNMFEGVTTEYERVLCFKDGILRRSLIWKSPKGREVKINIERLISFRHKNIASISYAVTPINFDGKVRLVSELDGNVTNQVTENDPRVGSGLKSRVLSIVEKLMNKTCGVITQRTHNSKFLLACAMEHELYSEEQYSTEYYEEELKVGVEFNVTVTRGKTVRLDKFVAYTTSRDIDEKEVLSKALEEVNYAKALGNRKLMEEQHDYLNGFWYKTDIEIIGDEVLQQGIRFNMFQLLQAAGRDGLTNIAAKGLTGEGYEGHYFWDTEVYMLPFFLYNNPEISRKLLEYRYSILPKARERARIMSHSKGALFPWRTINGEECSAYFPAGTAQYHIDADIAFAIKRYMEATEDVDFLVSYGAEMLFETARLWADLGEFIESKDNKFCINEVTGPDEYTALVNNNCYTNLMARENLIYAYRTALYLKETFNSAYEALVSKIALKEEEINFWKNAADNMYIPYDEKLEIHPQDDGFLSKTPWDFKNTPKDKYPLLIHFHPLVIYRHQVCKQADLILAEFLLSQKFSKEQKKRDFDFYEKLTTHDSSLSTCIFSIAASEIGYHDKAYKYFIETAVMDLTNSHGNTKDGIHAANMAGTWMCLVNGFAGMRAYEDTLSFETYLPKQWKEYSFKITYRGRLIEVRVTEAAVSFKLLQGENIDILSHGEKIHLTYEK